MAAAKIYKLQNQIKHYEWGSPALMPQFLGIGNLQKKPYAEMWMGTHDSAPSKAQTGSASINLKDIAGELPFLFKILGVEKPLSIQAHPSLTKAQDGFRREEEEGIALNAPLRNYKDANHKPEMLCAVTPFKLMAGFRQPQEIHKCLEEFLILLPQLKELITPLLRALDTGSLAVFFRNLYLFSDIGREYFSRLISESMINTENKFLSSEQWLLMKNFADQYPTDPAILSPLYLNLVTMQPLQAIYIPDGVLHAYISGFGVELMAASDNVIRGGLTPKYVNIAELMNIVNFNPFYAGVFSPDTSSVYRYPSLCDDFSLLIMRSEGNDTELCEKGPAICLVVEGELTTCGMKFKKGESFFVPENSQMPSLSGNFSLFCAYS